MYTTDSSIADFFVVPQWENLFYGNNYHRDLIQPLIDATESYQYKQTSPRRNHIFIYISDDTPLFEERIPLSLRNALKERFIRITYSGRITNFGKYHNRSQSDSIFQFDSSDEIVVPPPVPIKAYRMKDPSRDCINDLYYEGTFDPPTVQVERLDSLNYMKKNFQIANKADSSYFGIHCSGYGIWTARFYNYLSLGIIPILFSDGVRMPFESFFNYKSFSLKILGSTCDTNDQKFVTCLKNACNICRNYSKGEQNNSLQEEKIVYERIINMQNNVKEISGWFDWKSSEPYKNPFTLIIIELYNRLNKTYVQTANPIAKEEYYDFNSENLRLYKQLS